MDAGPEAQRKVFVQKHYPINRSRPERASSVQKNKAQVIQMRHPSYLSFSSKLAKPSLRTCQGN